MMQRDVEAHKCPKCGKSEWWHFSGLQDEKPAPAVSSLIVFEANYRMYVSALLTVAVVVMASIILGDLLVTWWSDRN